MIFIFYVRPRYVLTNTVWSNLSLRSGHTGILLIHSHTICNRRLMFSGHFHCRLEICFEIYCAFLTSLLIGHLHAFNSLLKHELVIYMLLFFIESRISNLYALNSLLKHELVIYMLLILY